MATLDSSTVGSIADVCSNIDFCSEVDFLGRPFHTYLHLDPCAGNGTIGIERFNLALDLKDPATFGMILKEL